MNRLKSIFIAFYPMVAMGIMGFASWRLYESRDVLAWVGTLLTVVPFVIFLSHVAFYEHHGFLRLASRPRSLFLALGTVEKVLAKR